MSRPWESDVDQLPSDYKPGFQSISSRGRAVGKLTLYSEADTLTALPRDYYLKGIISPAEMSVIYGIPGCGKSFFVLYVARALSQGRAILGRRVHQTNVLFLALEGVAGFENRLRAEIQNNQQSEGFGYIAQPINLFDDATAKDSVIQAAGLLGAGIIVIDTLNRAMSGGSENDPADMGQFILNIDAIRAATGCHVIIIHHCGKDAGRGLRGHSSLLGAADVVIEVTKDDTTSSRRAFIEKAKDDADGSSFNFALDVHELGVDQDGDKITTCVVREENDSVSAKSKKKPISGASKLALDQLRNAIIELGIIPDVDYSTPAGVTCVTLAQWKAKLEKAAIINSEGNSREQLKRIRVTLGAAGYIGVNNDLVWLQS